MSQNGFQQMKEFEQSSNFPVFIVLIFSVEICSTSYVWECRQGFSLMKFDLMEKSQKWRFTIAVFSIDTTLITILSIWSA